MFYPSKKVLTIMISILILNINAYSQNNLNYIDNTIKEKNIKLSKTPKSHTTHYMSLYDEIAELTISKNKLLIKMDKIDDIDTDKTCDFALQYGEVEFIKTEYYKTPFHDEVAKTLQNITKLFEQCHPPMAGKYLNSVLQIKEHIYGKESAEAAKAYDVLADHYRIYMADFKKSIKQYEKAKDIREKLYGVKDPRVTENYKKFSVSLFYHGDKSNQAEKLLLNSINIRENSPSYKDFPLYLAYMDLGIYYSMKDEYDKSIVYLQKALKSYEGKVNINYIVIISELSQNYLNLDNLRQASKYGEEAYRVARKFYGSDEHYLVITNRNSLREINYRMNK